MKKGDVVYVKARTMREQFLDVDYTEEGFVGVVVGKVNTTHLVNQLSVWVIEPEGNGIDFIPLEYILEEFIEEYEPTYPF